MHLSIKTKRINKFTTYKLRVKGERWYSTKNLNIVLLRMKVLQFVYTRKLHKNSNNSKQD